MLLSFAQLEREVTVERMRDKFAASKRKGLWMGGWVPSSLRMIAAAEVSKSERYVSKLIRSAFLAPDLFAAVLAGRAPTPLTLAELMKYLPWDWNEQPRRTCLLLGLNREAEAGARLAAQLEYPRFGTLESPFNVMCAASR